MPPLNVRVGPSVVEGEGLRGGMAVVTGLKIGYSALAPTTIHLRRISWDAEEGADRGFSAHDFLKGTKMTSLESAVPRNDWRRVVPNLTELPRLKEGVLAIDPDAMLIVNDALEVIGKRLRVIKQY